MSALANLPSARPNHPSTMEEPRHGMAIIDKIDQDIEALENETKNIRTKIYYLKLARAHYAFQICPLRRLPIEILTEIVRMCIAQNDDILTIAGVCSRLREIILGMTAIWSKISLQTSTRTRGNKGYRKRIHGPYGPGYYGDVRCTTLEQLELVLKRAGQATLDLRVQWPPEPGTLELISSRKCPIHSLDVSVDPDSKTSFSTRRFLGLNVVPLNRVGISNVDWKKAKGLMDLALRSSCSEIALEMDEGEPTLRLFKHDLLRRVESLHISTSDATLLNNERFVHGKIPLPEVKILSLFGDIRVLDVLDFKNIEELSFLHSPTGRLREHMRRSFPTRLTSLSLGMVEFTRKYRVGNRPQILPTLTFLSFSDVSFEGPVRDYLQCPKLEVLSYHDFAAELQPVEEGTEPDEDFARVLFDEPFFQGVPDLKSISFRGLIVDDVLVNILEGCSLLHTLELEDCLMLGFIPSFSKSINNKACFPSLKTIKLETSWPEDAKVSYRGFVDECRAKRPQMWVSGNAKSALPSLLGVPITLHPQVDGNSSDSTSF